MRGKPDFLCLVAGGLARLHGRIVVDGAVAARVGHQMVEMVLWCIQCQSEDAHEPAGEGDAFLPVADKTVAKAVDLLDAPSDEILAVQHRLDSVQAVSGMDAPEWRLR